MTENRYSAPALVRYATDLLGAAGMDAALAAVVAETLVEGDLLGHDTHGLALLAPYIKEIQNGAMTLAGSADVVSDRGASLLWDGRRLPGPWLVRQGLDTLVPRARQFGSATLVIRRSHHIACLAAYLLRATEQGMMLLLASSDPAVASVAPFGGRRAVFTPDPIAAGIPTSGTPFLVDISSSIVTNGMSGRLQKAGKQFGHDCMLDAQGLPSRDPAVLNTDPPGTIMPLGGQESGHKGFGLALIVEALTGGLAGHGRANPPAGWGATVFMTLYDPTAFAGSEAFTRQTDWIAESCRSNPPVPDVEAVRLPGDRGMASRAAQMRDGVALHATIAPMLVEHSERYGIPFPSAING
ncbi:Ldh family oxidoreductase [Devosia sp.]|uniref:Ldh family oxidoreductase n=1 Tax=Devosia sp. TaxID=1871048 RepID=UPI002FC7C1C2